MDEENLEELDVEKPDLESPAIDPPNENLYDVHHEANQSTVGGFVNSKRCPLSIKRLTEIHRALEMHQGNRFKAANYLKIKYRTLLLYIQDNPSLKARWSGEKKRRRLNGFPRDIDKLSEVEVNGKMFPSVAVPDEVARAAATNQQLAESMEREQEKFKRGLDHLGLTEKEKELAMAMQAFHSQQFKQSIEIQGAGVTRLSIKFQTVIDHIIGKRLAKIWEWLDNCGKDDPQRSALIREERLLMSSLVELSSQALRNSEVANRGAMTMALIRWRMRQGDKQDKPGFTNTVDVASK